MGSCLCGTTIAPIQEDNSSDVIVKRVTHITADIHETIHQTVEQNQKARTGSFKRRNTKYYEDSNKSDSGAIEVIDIVVDSASIQSETVNKEQALQHFNTISPAESKYNLTPSLPVRGILKVKPTTPDHKTKTVGERGKIVAEKALNLINPTRQYEKRRKRLQKNLAWWEDQNIKFKPRRTILFDDVTLKRTSSDTSLQRMRKWRQIGNLVMIVQSFNELSSSFRYRSCSDPELKLSEKGENENESEYTQSESVASSVSLSGASSTLLDAMDTSPNRIHAKSCII